MAMHYTIHHDSRIDERVQRDLDAITAALRAQVEGLVAVTLTGGFSRGEGSIIRRGEEVVPLNDYDIVVITEEPGREDFAAMGNALAEQVGIRHVDVLPLSRPELSRMPCTMLHYDLRHGGLVLWGPKDILAAIPGWHEREIPLAEAETLLLNRMVCLLESFSLGFRQQPPQGDQRRFLRFQTAKGILAAADALLVVKRRYHFLYRERADRFALEFKFDPRHVEMVRRALAYKLDPGQEPESDPVADWLECRSFLLEALEFLLPLRYPYGLQFGGWLATAEFYAQLRPERFLTAVECAELLLLAALVGDDIDNTLVRRAGAFVNAPDGADWETVRERVVRAWHER
jgi:hypothetical protein